MRRFFNKSAAWRSPLALVTAVLLAMFGLVTPSQATTSTTPYADINESVVYIETDFPTEVFVPIDDGSTESYTYTVTMRCSGSVVSTTGHILTAAHCVKADVDVDKAARDAVMQHLIQQGYGMDGVNNVQWAVKYTAEPSVYVSQPQPTKQEVFRDGELQVRIVASQTFETGDNALLQISNVTGMKPLAIASTTPAVGESVKSFGFPKLTDGATTTQRQDPTFRTLTITRHASTVHAATPILEVDGEILGGMSGGPALNASNQIVGVNSAGYAGMSVSYVTDTQIMTTFLKSNGVDVVAAQPEPPAVDTGKTPGADTGTDTTTPDTKQPTVVPPTSNSADSGGSNTGLIIGGVAFVLLLAGVGGYFMMQGKNGNAKSTGRRAADK